MTRKNTTGGLVKMLGPLDQQNIVTKETAELTPPTSSASAQPRTPLPPSRQGKKALTGYFDPAVVKQLKMMAAAEETTIQALLSEALNDLFKKRGKPNIA